MAAKKTDARNTMPAGSDTQDVLTGQQSLVTGLVYDADGKPIIPEIEDEENVHEVQQIGAFRRVIYTDGRVATTQTEPLNATPEIQTPVPAPGDVQDQTGAGLADELPAAADVKKN